MATLTPVEMLELKMMQLSAAAFNERRRGYAGEHGATLVKIHAQIDEVLDMWAIIHLDLEVEPDAVVGTE